MRFEAIVFEVLFWTLFLFQFFSLIISVLTKDLNMFCFGLVLAIPGYILCLIIEGYTKGGKL